MSLPAPRSMLAPVTPAPSVTLSLPVPPRIVSTLLTVGGVGAKVAEGERVVAGAEVDAGAVGCGAEGDGSRRRYRRSGC